MFGVAKAVIDITTKVDSLDLLQDVYFEQFTLYPVPLCPQE